MRLKDYLKRNIEGGIRRLSGTLPEDFSLEGLSWEKKLDAVGDYCEYSVLRTDNEEIYFGVRRIDVVRHGRSVHLSKRTYAYIAVRDGKVRVQGSAHAGLFLFFEEMGINWCRDLSSVEKEFLLKPAILRRVLTGSVYSQETLWKIIGSICFHAKGIPWKTLRDFFLTPHCSNVNILDIICFTKNPAITLSVLTDNYRILNVCNNEETRQYVHLLQDCIISAVFLDEKVDAKWSVNRLRSEHKRQILEANKRKFESMSEEEIFPDCVGTDAIRMLNTEKDVFLEGVEMSHCIYTHYFKDIGRRKLLAFHMSSPEDCTFSVMLDYAGNGPVIQQIYKAHNVCVSEETKRIASDFVKDNSHRLLSLFANAKTDDDADYLPF